MGKKKGTSKTQDSPEIIELDEMNVILKIPKDAVTLEVTASIIRDGGLQKVTKTLTVSDIHTMRQDFLDNVEGGDEYDAIYVLTDEGRRYLEEQEQTRMNTRMNARMNTREELSAGVLSGLKGGDAE